MPHAAQGFYAHVHRMADLLDSLYDAANTSPNPRSSFKWREQADMLKSALSEFLQTLSTLSEHPETQSVLIGPFKNDSYYVYTQCFKEMQGVCEPGGTDLLATHCGYVQAFLDAPERFISLLREVDPALEQFREEAEKFWH